MTNRIIELVETVSDKTGRDVSELFDEIATTLDKQFRIYFLVSEVEDGDVKSSENFLYIHKHNNVCVKSKLVA